MEERQAAQKKAAQAQMAPIDKEGQQADDAKKKAEDDKTADQKPADDTTPKRKPPTLLRPGEKKQ